ncbi:AMP-binding protein [Sphingomonas sp.]|uniref:AMP-binding protein n=1 Tax=Sphingomonas sp. TaxID=28214 RepID=UPI003AFFA922
MASGMNVTGEEQTGLADQAAESTRGTVGEILQARKVQFGDATFLVHGDRRLSFAEVDKTVDQAAASLLGLGIRRGDQVGLWLGNSIEWAVWFFACARIGAPVVPISTRYKAEEMAYVVAHADCRALIVNEPRWGIDFHALLLEVAPELTDQQPDALALDRFPQLRHVLLAGEERRAGARTLAEIGAVTVSDAALAEAAERVDRSDLLLISYTSGTTGAPKGVMHSHAVVTQATRVGLALRIAPGEAVLGHMPFYHVAGLFMGLLPVMTLGAKLVILDDWTVDTALELIGRERVSVFGGIPTHFVDLVASPKLAEYDLSSLMSAWIGGSSATREQFERIRTRLGIPKLFSTYGMTENTISTTFNRWEDPLEVIYENKAPLLADCEVIIADPDTGAERATGEDGEIWCRGSTVMLGYYKNPEATREAIDPEGWLRTGDIGHFDAKGYLSITGRRKDMFKIGGTNAYPAEIEQHLSRLPDVLMSAVVGAPDDRLGEVGYAFVQRAAGSTLSERDVIAHCRGQIADYKVPRHVRFVEDFPRTPSGKIKKYELAAAARQALAERRAGTGGSARMSPAGLTAFLEPRRIAVVGASPGRSGYPNLVLANLRTHGFEGDVVAVHPKHDRVDGVAAFPSISAIPDRPDLCVIAVRAELVPGVLRECVDRGVPAVTIVASGFAEQGDENGRALQRELADIISGSGTRVLGPNCLGIASFATNSVGIASGNIPATLPRGRGAIVSQSGGVGLAMMLRGVAQGLGLGQLVSVGNELDVSVAEWLECFAAREDVDAILCYIEGVRDVRRFRTAMAACQRAGKAVIILRGGATKQGKAAAASHTGALSGDGAVWRGFLSQIGAIEARSIDHAIATMRLFLAFGVAQGRSVGGFGGGGGLTVLFTDLLASIGIDTPALGEDTRRRIRAALPDVTPHNPMEMGGLFLSGDGSALQAALEALSADPGIDALALCVPPYLEARDRQINGAIVRATEGLSKPVIVISYAPSDTPSVLKEAGRFILEPPEAGVQGLKSWLDHRPGGEVAGDADAAVSGTAGGALRLLAEAGQTVVLEDAAKDLLRGYGVRCPMEATARSAEEALAAGERFGYPVALKILSPAMMHRGIGKGVLLNLSGREQLAEAFEALRKTAEGLSEARILVQAMAAPGMEFLVGAVRDPELGLALAVGRGGVNAEALREVLFFVPPVTGGALRALLAEWPPLVEAQRRDGPIDLDALVRTVAGIAALLHDGRDVIEEMDVNPVIVGKPGEGSVAVDALILLRNGDAA